MAVPAGHHLPGFGGARHHRAVEGRGDVRSCGSSSRFRELGAGLLSAGVSAGDLRSLLRDLLAERAGT